MYELRSSSDQSISMQGKQAKMVNPTQEQATLGDLATTRYPVGDRVLFLLSMKAALRVKEMTSLTWAMVTDARGSLSLSNRPLVQAVVYLLLCDTPMQHAHH